MRSLRGRLLTGLFASGLAAALASGVVNWRPMQALDNLIYDSRLRFSHADHDAKIVIVDIDEKSLADQGRWPWSRSLVATLLENVSSAKAIGVDILFAEKQENPELILLAKLQADPALAGLATKLEALGKDLNHDRQLASALEKLPVVLGYYFTNDKAGHRVGSLPAELLPAQLLQARGWRLSDWDGYSANLPSLASSAPLSGFFNPKVDNDGVLRELILLAQHQGKVYESLSLAVLRTYLGTKGSPAAFTVNDGGIRIGKTTIPATDQMTALIPFAGQGGPNAGRFRYVSATDVIEGRVAKSSFADKIVLIGTSTVGLTDLRATPVSSVFPGVEVQANLISGVLGGAIKTHPPGAGALAAAFTFILGLVLTLTMPRVSASGVIVIAVLALASVISFFSLAYSGIGWKVNIAPALSLILVLFGVYAVSGYFLEGRTRVQIAERFGEYVSPQVVQRMLDAPEKYSATSENRELTLLFADIRGFTRKAETMQPEALHIYINRFLTSMTDVILSYNGTVDKYMGDAVMAFWGAPMDDEFHADHAVSCALAMVQEAAKLNSEFRAQGLPDLQIGIGINTGRVLVGEMGSQRRRTYTAIGDPVNLAARLEQLTKQFDAKIIVGESTMRAAAGHSFRELGSVLISGRMESAIIFEPTRLDSLEALVSDDLAQSDEPSSVSDIARKESLATFGSSIETAALKLPRSMQGPT